MNERGYMTTNATYIQGKTEEYHEQLYSDKFGNLDETNTFLERQKVLKLTEKEKENLKSSIFVKEIELVIKNLPMEKTPSEWILSNI